MDPIHIDLNVVPAAEIEQLRRRCNNLEDRVESLDRQMDALRCLYSQCLEKLRSLTVSK